MTVPKLLVFFHCPLFLPLLCPSSVLSLNHCSTAPLLYLSLLLSLLFLIASLTFPPAIKPSIPSVHCGLHCDPPLSLSPFFSLLLLHPSCFCNISHRSCCNFVFLDKISDNYPCISKISELNHILQWNEASISRQNIFFPHIIQMWLWFLRNVKKCTVSFSEQWILFDLFGFSERSHTEWKVHLSLSMSDKDTGRHQVVKDWGAKVF